VTVKYRQGHRQSYKATNRKLIYELLLVVYSNFRPITYRFEMQTVLMLKTTFFAYPVVFDLEFECHAVGM